MENPKVLNYLYLLWKISQIKGLIGDLLLTYDKAEGTMAFKTQQVGLLSGYYLGCTTSNSAWGSFYPTYVSYQLGVMFGLVAVVQQAPFGFTFEDDGIFQQMSGKGKADNLIFDRYSSPDYGEAAFVQGVACIYEYMSFMKVEE